MKKLILVSLFMGAGACMAAPANFQTVIMNEDGAKILVNEKIYYARTASDYSFLAASQLCFLVGAIQFLRGTYKNFFSDTGTYKKSLADFDEDALRAMNPKELEKLLDQEDETRLTRLENLKTYLNSAVWLGVSGLCYLYGNSGRDKALTDPKLTIPADPKALGLFDYVQALQKVRKI